MKKLHILLCFSCFLQIVQAQNYIHEFGKTCKEELELQQYPNDTTAAAVVIYDIGKSYFITTDEGFRLIFERKTKIKILTNAGLNYAEFSIPYYDEKNKFEEINELKGNTYNLENGKVRISELNRKTAFIEKEQDNRYNKKFAMPDVKVGSVIEISYKIRSPFIFHFRNWVFQYRIPVIYSEYTTLMVPFYEYTYLFQGATKFDEYKSYADKITNRSFANIEYYDMVYVFIMKDVPAFKDETFITSIDDYIIKIDFQLSSIHHPTGFNEEIITTWPKLSKGLLDNDYFGKYLKKCQQRGQEITDTMPLGSKPALEKAKYIDHFVKSTFKWNGDNSKYASKTIKDLMVSKTGNSADINLLLVGLLNAAGVEAYPVIISTRDHGMIKIDYPFEHFFNYVIAVAKIDSSMVLLDATEPLSNFTEIPSQCLNMMGLTIKDDKPEWVNLKSNVVSSSEYNFDLRVNPDKDSITQICQFSTTGYQAMKFRNRYAESYKEVKDFLLGTNSGVTDSLKVINAIDIEKPFILNYTIEIPVEKVEDKIIISPFCDRVITENPLKMPSRNYSVDFTFKEAKNYFSTIVIPDGYKILSLPENLMINNSIIKIKYVATVQDDNTVKIIGSYMFRKDLYDASDYLDVKGYFNKIVDKFNEKLILVKTM